MSLQKIAWILVIIGGLNWLLVGIGGFVDMNLNVVNLLLGSWPAVEWIVYIVVGLATVYQLIPSRGSDNSMAM